MRLSSHTQLARLTLPRTLKIWLAVAGSAELVAAAVLIGLPASAYGLRLFAGMLAALGIHSLVSMHQTPYSMRTLLNLRILTAGAVCLASGLELMLRWPEVPGSLMLVLITYSAVSIPLWFYWLVRVGRLPQ